MRNLLLTTTALATLAAGSAFAGGMPKDTNDMEIKLGGELQAEAGFNSQKTSYKNATSAGLYTADTGGTATQGVADSTTVFKRGVTPGNNSVGFNSIAAMHALVQNKTASGLKYGAQVGLLTTTRGTDSPAKPLLDRTYLFMENDMGRIELGTNQSSSESMRIGADSIARATGGIDGHWASYTQTNTFNSTQVGGGASNLYTLTNVRSSNFITNPGTLFNNIMNTSSDLLDQAVVNDEESRKITYYTPSYNGFQAGVSYIPDLNNTGDRNFQYLNTAGLSNALAGNFGQYSSVTVKNGLTGGISWKDTFHKDHQVKVSVVGETGTVKGSTNFAPAQKFYNARQVIVGAEYMYKAFGVAASYGNQGKSGFDKSLMSSTTRRGVKGGSYWTVGGSWSQDAFGTSLTFMQSKLNKNKFNLVSLGADYEVAPGLLPYAEVSYFNMKQRNDYWAPNMNSTQSSITNAAGATTGSALNSGAANINGGNAKNNGTAFILGTKVNF